MGKAGFVAFVLPGLKGTANGHSRGRDQSIRRGNKISRQKKWLQIAFYASFVRRFVIIIHLPWTLCSSSIIYEVQSKTITSKGLHFPTAVQRVGVGNIERLRWTFRSDTETSAKVRVGQLQTHVERSYGPVRVSTAVWNNWVPSRCLNDHQETAGDDYIRKNYSLIHT